VAVIYVLDTHALLWFLTGSPRLGPGARAVLEDHNVRLVLPVIALAEACWLIERGRVSLTAEQLLSAIDQDPRIELVALDRDLVARTVSLTTVGEMHDRQIVAVAVLLRERGSAACVLTRDENITASGVVPVLW
jgi:PIN domain nuclease of toxin-antitoxin system